MPSFESLPARRNIPLLIFADHASAHIPARLNNLGLRGADLTRHIAHDIGTDGLTRRLCSQFGCEGHIASVSRLVIDCNRGLDAPGLIPTHSDGTKIIANANIEARERSRRINEIYRPYHDGLSRAIDRSAQRTLDPLIVSMHSFTPQLQSGGSPRLTEIGLLFKTDEVTAYATREGFMRMGRNFTIGMNAPYSAFDLNHTVDTHVTPAGLRHVTFEIRQDLIDTEKKVDDMAGVLETVIEPLIYKRTYPDPILP